MPLRGLSNETDAAGFPIEQLVEVCAKGNSNRPELAYARDALSAAGIGKVIQGIEGDWLFHFANPDNSDFHRWSTKGVRFARTCPENDDSDCFEHGRVWAAATLL